MVATLQWFDRFYGTGSFRQTDISGVAVVKRWADSGILEAEQVDEYVQQLFRQIPTVTGLIELKERVQHINIDLAAKEILLKLKIPLPGEDHYFQCLLEHVYQEYFLSLTPEEKRGELERYNQTPALVKQLEELLQIKDPKEKYHRLVQLNVGKLKEWKLQLMKVRVDFWNLCRLVINLILMAGVVVFLYFQEFGMSLIFAIIPTVFLLVTKPNLSEIKNILRTRNQISRDMDAWIKKETPRFYNQQLPGLIQRWKSHNFPHLNFHI